ncbi:hypothetical protein Tco_0272065 [Tanacetum coccineum]
MENANPPPTNNLPVMPTALRAKNIDQFLNCFSQPPNEINMDDLEPDDESIDTPLVSPFLDSDDDSDDGEVLN